MAWQQDSWYWLNDAKDGWLAVQFVEQKGDVVTLKSAEDEHYEVPASPPLKAALPSSLGGHSNMLNLGELHEGAILHNLRSRYATDCVYTYISSIVLSINPYKQLPCYGPGQIALYRKMLANGGAEASAATGNDASKGNVAVPGQPLPPHVYALADGAYASLLRDQVNQAIIISGESGAGKTEATKLCLQYLAEISGQNADIAQQILEANPILEAFGNAKTVRNNNSSRFGKWCEIHFDASTLRIRGASIISYLLEKSRVVNQAAGERNYHAPYFLIAGASPADRAALHLSADASSYRLLNRGACLVVDGVNDAAEYSDMVKALEILRFSADEITQVMQIVAAILHCGNIDFERTAAAASAGAADAERYAIANPASTLAFACELLSLDSAQCARALTTKQLRIAGGEVITVFNSAQTCVDNRDALVKSLYEALFLRLLHSINNTLQKDSPQNPKCIGVLDIFGFENFDQTGNFFEQLCINYANEALQSHFTQHVFALEQKEYAREGINVSEVGFVDNAACLALIEERRVGIIDMIVEEIRLPKGSDMNLLQRMHDAYAPTSAPHAPADKTTYAKPAHAYYVRPKGAQTKEMIFSIRHFAGDVSYQVAGFLEKNKDSLSELLRETIESSTAEHVAKLLTYKHQQASGSAVSPSDPKKMTMRFSVDQGQPGQNGNAAAGAGSTPAIPSPSPSPPGASPRSGSSSSDRTSAALNTTPAGFSLASPSALAKKRFSDAGSLSSPLSPVTMGAGSPSASAAGLTLGAQFRSQLSDLLATLNSCRSNFIRCLKPNASKIPDHFDSVFVLAQLQYLGIKEVIAIRQLGFPVRIKQGEFLKRYGLLVGNGADAAASSSTPSTLADVKSRVSAIFDALKLSDADWRFGLTQVFFRSVCHTALESARDAKFVEVVTKLQALYRCKLLRTKYKRMQKASRRLQAAVSEAQEQSQRGSTVVAADSSSKGAPTDAAWSLEIDAALTESTDLGLPSWRLVEARKIRARAVEVAQARRALAGAIQVKDVPLLRGAIQRAVDIKLDAATPELTAAQTLLERLIKYLVALTAAIEARSIESLQSVLAEAASLQLDSSAERDAHALLRRLQEERACEDRLDALVASRGPLAALTEAISAAELLGLTASNSVGSHSPSSIHRSLKSSSLAKAVVLATLLAREESLLKSLADAIKARDLSSLDASLSEITSDASLEAIHSHASVTTARALKAELKAAALASECAAHVRAALASRNAPHIESSLVSLRELGAEALASLGAGVAAALEAEAQTVLASIRARGAALVRLQAALEERSLPALQSALAFASAQPADARCSELAEFSAATKTVAAFTTVLAALESSTASRDLVALQSALEQASKLGLDASTSASVAVAFAMRAKLQRIVEVKGVLRSAVTANDEGMLTMALERAKEAELEASEPEVAQAQAALNSLRAKALQAEEEARAAVAAMEAEKARAAAEAEAASHAAAAHAAAQALAASAKASAPAHAPDSAASSSSSAAVSSSAASAASPSSASSSARSSVSGRPLHPKVFQPDLYRAGHFALSLFPLLRSPDDFARNKLFGKKELALSMLSWSKDPLPRSLLKLSTDDASSNACNLFRAVQGFMGDRAYSFPDGLGCEVLAAGVATPELRDEIFVQLAKQLHNNASVESVRKGWQLMGLACESFAPSESFRPFLYHFLLSFQDQVSYHARNYVAFCLRILQQQAPGCSVATAPVIAHVAAFRERVMQSAEVAIFFPDGSSFTILLDPSVTTRQVMDQLLERAGLNAEEHLPSMALFHQASYSEEPVALLPSACPLDFPAAKIGPTPDGEGGVGCRFLLSKRIWSAELSQEPWSPAFAALLKHGASASSMSLVADMSLPDQLLLSILFYQHVLDLLRFEHYALSRAELVHVVSVYQKVVELQVLPLIAESHGTAIADMAALQPAVAASWTEDERAGFAREVSQAKSRLASAASYSPFALLDSAWSSRPNHGYASFPVQNPELKSLPELVIVGVSINGLFLIDAQTKAVLKQFKFAHVTGWAANTIKFSLRVLIAKAKTQQLNFATPIGKRITATIQEFVDFIVARNTKLKAIADGHGAH